MSFYADKLSLATNLVTKYGKSVQLLRGTAVIGRPSCVFTGRAKGDMTAPGSSTISGTTQANLTCVVTAEKEPLVGDSLRDGNTTYRILAVETVRPADTTLVYRLELT